MTLKLIYEYDAEGEFYQKIEIPYENQLPAEILKKLELPEGIDFNYGVVIDGKAPNWFYSYLAYQCQNAAWVGCYYPQLEGAIVVHSQTPTVEVGQIQGSTKNNLLNGNLELKVNEVITVDGDRYQCLLIHAVDISPQVLDSLTLPSDLNWNREIVLWGQAPVWLYTHLVMRCQQASWVACYNIRTTEAVVVVSQCPKLVPGDKFKLVPKSPCPAIVFGGPPNSGKSLLGYTLKETLVKMGWNNKVYLHRTTWDGEGDWFAQMMRTNPELANELSKIAGRRKKPENTAEYFSQQAEVIKEIRRYTDLVLVDLGGMPREADKILLPSCTHYIIISNSKEAVDEWHKFFQIVKTDTEEELIPLAVIHSVEDKKVKIVNREPYLEIIAGPWRYGETETAPQELVEQVMKLIRE
ncbi:CRISPR-associated ring nuclease Crn3/Csx3 [Nostoc sp. 'Peltigera membranacea cyanobiont' 232]|uniref:CRISPR-associated ring nuclease Crn3/Csx3 n=1 Tax=Nostoc sp. 'Peltigera membranacea cyanobiont' 232 TaxID=2014531 RepID=UPI00167BA73F|nr:CRISPR-associated ring nuclease Crn3/Csx3 [Nostoc sp. 'Peltigera membranacea cyanobiont' 232]